MAGVWIFSPPRLLTQEPRGQERQGLMMMPGDPVPHLIVAQAGLAFGTLKTLFDTMSRLGHAGQFLQRRGRARIRQVIIKFKTLIGLKLPRQEQQFLGTCSPLLGPRLNPTLHRFDYQRSFLSVTHLDSGPSIVGKIGTPTVHTLEWLPGMWPTSRVLRQRRLEVANRCVRGYRKQIPLAASPQFQAKTGGTTHFVRV